MKIRGLLSIRSYAQLSGVITVYGKGEAGSLITSCNLGFQFLFFNTTFQTKISERGKFHEYFPP